MRIFLSPPDVGDLERQYVDRALAGGWVAPTGPDLLAFENDISAITGWPGAVALSSGTAALHLALLAVGVRPGDYVMCSTFTFAASVNAIRYCGATPIFIDSEPESWNMCPTLLAEAMTDARRSGHVPAAVLVVDLYGQCADFDPIMAICHEMAVPVVEDAAEALGARYKGRPAGSLGDVGIFSFNGNKIMTTSGGGMLVSPDLPLADRVRFLSTQARMPVSHYEHQEVGYNYRLSNILAALGRAQLTRLPEMLRRRLEIHSMYRELLGDLDEVSFMPVPAWSEWNGWLTCLAFAHSTVPLRIQAELLDNDIECRPLWKPMHAQPAFANYPSWINGTSDRLFGVGLCLPSGSTLLNSDVELVASTVRRQMRRKARA